MTALIAGFTKTSIMLLLDTVNLHIHLYIRFPSTAGQDGTSTCTKRRLALLAIIVCDMEIVTLLLLYLRHKWVVYNGVQKALNSATFTEDACILLFAHDLLSVHRTVGHSGLMCSFGG